MCQFLLWLALLGYIISHAEGEYIIKARKGNVTTRNFQTARLEWYFNFQQTTFMSISIVTDSSKVIKRIAFKNEGRQFQLYDTMRDRAKISTPYQRHGVRIDILNIAISDGGNYRCQAIMRSGKIIKNITRLSVIVPPRINAHQTRLYRKEGQNASLLCNLEAGNPKPLSFQWFNITGRKKYPKTPVKFRDFNLTYYIENVGRDHLGRYECYVRGRGPDGGTDSHTVDLFVKYKPVVIVPPRNRSVLENKNVEILTCTCEGNEGETRYHWYKDCPNRQCEIRNDQTWQSQRIYIVNNGRGLKFVRPPRKLAAIYYCAGSNTLGLGRAKGAFLNVTYEPGPIEIVTADGHTINGIEGKNMTVNCYSHANPPAHYNWIKLVRTFLGTFERERLVTSSTTGNLKLYKVDRNDTARYICEALNRPNAKLPSEFYKVTRQVNINIIFGPRQTNFTINERNYTYQEVTQHSKVVIRCVSHSEPGANFNIRKERVQTQLNKNVKRGIYTIDSIKESHEGIYFCYASNSITLKQEVKRIELVVSIPPTTVDPIPDSKILAEGSTVAINCHAKGKPPPTVYWQRYGANITHNDSVIQTFYSVRPLKFGSLSVIDAVLKFTRIRYTDDASYSCIVNNTAGKINITNIRYQVQYPPKLTQYPGNFTRLERQKAKFVCQAHANPNLIQWKWLFNDIEITREVSNTFTIEYTKRSDNGKYQCVPRNALGDGQIGTGHLEVQYEPTFTLTPNSNYTRDRRESLMIRCDAEAVPIPEIFWRKLADSTFYRIGKELIFDSLEPKDRGLYSCVAKNVVSSKSVSTIIIIRHGPIITTNTPSDTKIGSEIGSPVSLQCDVDAYPEAKIQWKDYIKDTVIVSGADYKIIEREKLLFSKSSILEFTVHSYQLGKKYVCHAENEHGTDNQVYQVLRKGKPDPPVSRSLKAVDELVPTIPVTVNINFTWIPGYAGGSEVQYYLLYKERRESQYREQFMDLTEGFKYVLKHQKAGMSYVYSMKAQNRYGVSQLYDPPLRFNTKDPPPDVANVTYERYGKDGESILISWYIFPIKNQRRDEENKQRWSYGIIRYRIADIETEWREDKILEIATRGSYLVENLRPEQLYVFHFILYDEYGNFGRPMLIGRFYPGYGYGLRSGLTEEESIAIGVGCGGAILIVSVIILVAICKRRKSAYGKASYGNGRTRVDIPVSTVVVKGGAYSAEIVRDSYYKADEYDDDEDLLATDSGSVDKSPPPAYNAIHYSGPPHDNNLNQTSMSDDQPLIYKSFNNTDDDYHKPERSREHWNSREQISSGERSREHWNSREQISSGEHLSGEPPNAGISSQELGITSHDSPNLNTSSQSIESDLETAYKYAEKFKKPGSGSGRESPNTSSVASSKPYRSDNEYIDETDENYVGQLV